MQVLIPEFFSGVLFFGQRLMAKIQIQCLHFAVDNESISRDLQYTSIESEHTRSHSKIKLSTDCRHLSATILHLQRNLY